MEKGKVINIRGIEKPPENPIIHFTVSIFLKNDKEINIEKVLAIEVNAQADLLIIAGMGWTKVYPIVNIEHYGFTEHRQEEAQS